MSYRVWVHSRQNGEIESKIIELEDKSDLSQWKKDNPGWHTKKQDVDKTENELVGEKAEEKSEVKTEDVNEELGLTADQLKQVVHLLKGNKIGNRRGLSLASFGNIHGVSYGERTGQKKLIPKYELLLKKLDGEIEKRHKSWFYKGVSHKR